MIHYVGGAENIAKSTVEPTSGAPERGPAKVAGIPPALRIDAGAQESRTHRRTGLHGIARQRETWRAGWNYSRMACGLCCTHSRRKVFSKHNTDSRSR